MCIAMMQLVMHEGNHAPRHPAEGAEGHSRSGSPEHISADRAVIDDLDFMIGTMSAEEADELWRFVKEQREFDKQFFGK